MQLIASVFCLGSKYLNSFSLRAIFRRAGMEVRAGLASEHDKTIKVSRSTTLDAEKPQSVNLEMVAAYVQERFVYSCRIERLGVRFAPAGTTLPGHQKVSVLDMYAVERLKRKAAGQLGSRPRAWRLSRLGVRFRHESGPRLTPGSPPAYPSSSASRACSGMASPLAKTGCARCRFLSPWLQAVNSSSPSIPLPIVFQLPRRMSVRATPVLHGRASLFPELRDALHFSIRVSAESTPADFRSTTADRPEIDPKNPAVRRLIEKILLSGRFILAHYLTIGGFVVLSALLHQRERS
jgi:hypothetical protein